MQPNLDHIKQKRSDSRDLIDRITLKIPGYQGYVEKAEMYDADRIVRNLIADQLQDLKTEINSVSSKLVKSGDPSVLTELQSLNTAIERIQKKCKYADYGGHASLTGLKISDDDKNRLLEYDWRLISTVEEIDKVVKEIRQTAAGEISAKIESVMGSLEQFEKSFNERKNVLMEVM